MRWLRVGGVAAAAIVLLAGCESFDGLTDLQVDNENEPNRQQALSSPTDLETLLGSSWGLVWQGMEDGTNRGFCGSAYAFSVAQAAMADEQSLSWGNGSIRDQSSEPRVAYNNDPSYVYDCYNAVPWYTHYSALSSVYDFILVAIEGDADRGPGDAFCDGAGVTNPLAVDCDRALAFGKMVQGMAMGYLAMMFDSAFVLDESVNLENVGAGVDTLALVPYPNVWAAARVKLEEAISLANGASWSLPTGWMAGNPLTATQFAAFTHAVLARWIPMMARTPAERDAADWAAVESHATAALANFPLSPTRTTGDAAAFAILGEGWLSNWYHNMVGFPGGFVNQFDDSWGRADYKTIGQYDQSGAYAAWLATPAAQRDEMSILTPDRRIHGAGGGTTPGLDFLVTGPSGFPASRGTYHWSLYSGSREYDIAFLDVVGWAPWMRPTEMHLTRAEARLRQGGVTAAVVNAINDTRVNRGQMTALTTANTMTEVMDALIYERRIEGYSICGGCPYFNRRGEGPLAPTTGSPAGTHHQGLVEGTPLHWPPPGQELDILLLPNYSYGGVGNEGGTLAPAPVSGMGDFAARGSRALASNVYVPLAERGVDGASDRLPHATALVRHTR